MLRRRVRSVLVIAALVSLGGSVACVTLNKERRTLDAAARASAGPQSRFAQLRDGITEYDLSGPDTGRTIVLLTGATVPFYLWDPTRDALAVNGFRVLRYNYYGRGFSDRPSLRYDLAMYDGQLVELLDSLGVRGKVDVAGISMGGVIAANFADRHPDLVRTLTLLDPGFSSFSRTPIPLGISGVGEFVTLLLATTLARGQRDDLLHPENFPDWTSRYEVQMQYPGFRRGFLETVRHDVFKRPARSFVALAENRTPMLILWGTMDRSVPFSRSDTVRAAFPRAEFHAIEGAAHLPQMEQPALVNRVLLDFLRRF